MSQPKPLWLEFTGKRDYMLHKNWIDFWWKHGKKREWRMSCPKISALLSQHWRHSAHCDCLGSCWRAIALTEDCKHARKRFWHGPVLLRAKSPQASALTHKSNVSEKSPGKKCGLWPWCCVMLHITASRGSMVQKEAGGQEMWWRFWMSRVRETPPDLWVAVVIPGRSCAGFF